MDPRDEPADEQPVSPEAEQLAPSDDPEAPEADALEQAAEVEPGSRLEAVTIPREVSEGDALDQAEEVVEDEEDR